MAARSLLIKPRKTGSRREYVSANLEPLGLLSIAAFVRKYSEHTVALLDAQAEDPHIEPIAGGLLRMGMSDAGLRARIESFRPQVVGISALFEVMEAEVVAIAALVKSVSPDIVVVVGGLDAGVRYAWYLGSGVVDLVVRGDGEETFTAILDSIDRRERATAVPGTCERLESGELRMNPPRARSLPLDAYPYPARDLVRRDLYDARRTQRVSLPFASDCPALLLEGSRGCPLRCAFCDIVAVQDEWNAHGPEYVVDQIEHCIERYGMRQVVFVDDNFMVDRGWALRVCELIIKRRLKIGLDVMSGVAVWTLKESVIDTLVRAGLRRILLPIESGNPETLRFIKKPVDLQRTIRMIDYCNRSGLHTCANLIIGFPFETASDIQRTIDWANASGVDHVSFYVAEPFEDARMYPIYRDNNWVWGTGVNKSWRTRYFRREQLEEIARKASDEYLKRRLRFYLRATNLVPYVLPKFSSVRRAMYALRMISYVLFDGHRTGLDASAIAVAPNIWFRRPAGMSSQN